MQATPRNAHATCWREISPHYAVAVGRQRASMPRCPVSDEATSSCRKCLGSIATRATRGSTTAPEDEDDRSERDRTYRYQRFHRVSVLVAAGVRFMLAVAFMSATLV